MQKNRNSLYWIFFVSNNEKFNKNNFEKKKLKADFFLDFLIARSKISLNIKNGFPKCTFLKTLITNN